jgi:hypothetical protein
MCGWLAWQGRCVRLYRPSRSCAIRRAHSGGVTLPGEQRQGDSAPSRRSSLEPRLGRFRMLQHTESLCATCLLRATGNACLDCYISTRKPLFAGLGRAEGLSVYVRLDSTVVGELSYGGGQGAGSKTNSLQHPDGRRRNFDSCTDDSAMQDGGTRLHIQVREEPPSGICRGR